MGAGDEKGRHPDRHVKPGRIASLLADISARTRCAETRAGWIESKATAWGDGPWLQVGVAKWAQTAVPGRKLTAPRMEVWLRPCQDREADTTGTTTKRPLSLPAFTAALCPIWFLAS